MLEANSLAARLARADRAWRESAATVGANVFQHFVHAIAAKGAFVAANAGLGGIGGQVPVAEFTVGA